jgi:hypothetical protein
MAARDRVIHHRGRRPFERAVAARPHHPDDLDVSAVPGVQRAADGDAGEIALLQRFIHDRHIVPLGTVLLGERAAFDEGKMQGAEVVARGEVDVEVGRLDGSGARDQKGPPHRARQRRRCDPSDDVHARRPSQLRVGGCTILVIVGLDRRDGQLAGGTRALSAERGVDDGRQQRGSDEEHRRQRQLRPDEDHPQSRSALTLADARGIAAQRVHRERARGDERGAETAQQAGQHAAAERDRHDARIDARVEQPRVIGRE